MRHVKQSISAVALALTFCATSVAAQDQDRTRDRDQTAASDQDRLRTRDVDSLIDTLYAAQLLQDRERIQLRDQLRDATSDADRDRIRDRIQEKLYLRAWDGGILLDDAPLYGGHLITQQEREQLRLRMRNASSAEERERIRAEHHALVQERARNAGEKLGDEPLYGRKLMTNRERRNLQNSLGKAANAAERERIRAENAQRMQVRAWERGLNPDHEPVYGGHMLTEQERAQFRQRLESAATAEARERIRAEHRELVQQRARARKEKAGEEPIYGGQMMTERQRNEFRKLNQKAETAELREQLRASHREMMANHAWEHGVFPGREPIYGGQMLTEQEREQRRQQIANAASAEARERARNQNRVLVQQRAREYGLNAGSEPIFGGEMMSIRDRQRLEQRLSAAKSDAERDRIRNEHAAQMQSRMQRGNITPTDPQRLRSMTQQRFEQQQRGMEGMGQMGRQQGGRPRG